MQAIVDAIRDLVGWGAVLEFNAYAQREPGITARRRVITVEIGAGRLGSLDLHGLERLLRPDEELALSSRVRRGAKELHLPMVDFLRPMSAIEASVWTQRLATKQRCGFYLVNSGRSFHGYGLRLLPRSEWYDYLSDLLLLERQPPPLQSNLIDHRWVGHSLRQRFSALRLTDNTGRLLRPTVVGQVSEEVK